MKPASPRHLTLYITHHTSYVTHHAPHTITHSHTSCIAHNALYIITASYIACDAWCNTLPSTYTHVHSHTHNHTHTHTHTHANEHNTPFHCMCIGRKLLPTNPREAWHVFLAVKLHPQTLQRRPHLWPHLQLSSLPTQQVPVLVLVLTCMLMLAPRSQSQHLLYRPGGCLASLQGEAAAPRAEVARDQKQRQFRGREGAV